MQKQNNLTTIKLCDQSSFETMRCKWQLRKSKRTLTRKQPIQLLYNGPKCYSQYISFNWQQLSSYSGAFTQSYWEGVVALKGNFNKPLAAVGFPFHLPVKPHDDKAILTCSPGSPSLKCISSSSSHSVGILTRCGGRLLDKLLVVVVVLLVTF